MDEVVISRAITESYLKDLLEAMELDVAIAGAGPAGMTAAYYLAREKVKTAIFERKLSAGGGIWGGGMMFNKIVVQDEGKEILDEFGVASVEYEKGYHLANAVEIDATGHDCEICRLVTEKVRGKLRTPNGKIAGEKSMWAEIAEKKVSENTIEVYPGLIVAGMATAAVFGSPRMGPIFGGMLLSGKKAAKLAIELLKKDNEIS